MTELLGNFEGEGLIQEKRRREAESFSILEFLEKVPIFQFLTPEERRVVASRFSLQTYSAGEVIFSKDEPGTTLHIIVSGAVKIYLPSAGGEEAPLGMPKSGDYFGELALLDGGSRTASAAALAPTATFTLERDDFLEFVTTHPEAAAAVFRAMAALVRRQNTQLYGEFFTA
jgi:CRP-like cAMP-binding protein